VQKAAWQQVTFGSTRRGRQDRRRPGAERQAYAEADRIAGDGVAEMQQITGAGLERLGGLLGQVTRTWDAADAPRDADREAGQ
jgi:hypothetical protein